MQAFAGSGQTAAADIVVTVVTVQNVFFYLAKWCNGPARALPNWQCPAKTMQLCKLNSLQSSPSVAGVAIHTYHTTSI